MLHSPSLFSGLNHSKSQMMRRAHDLAPRSVYIGGNTSTTTGLTVSVVRDGNDTTLEAGALVLADHGVCCKGRRIVGYEEKLS